MKLLIDAGNTRIKWALMKASDRLAHGALRHDEIFQLQEIAAEHLPLVSIVGSNVAGEAVGQAIAAALSRTGVSPAWVVPCAHCCGVRNLYETPSQLGADRWAALIGARAEHAGPCVVVSAGTATTIDLLEEDGRFLGGLIIPGAQLMRNSLSRDTANLPLADGEACEFPRNTVDAIVTGCLLAQAGAIERIFQHIAHRKDALCILAGGAAERIEPWLQSPRRRIDDLVLRGLARIASDEVALKSTRL